MTAREDVARWLYDDQRPATVPRWADLPEWVREEWREKADPLLDDLAPHTAAATAAARAEALAEVADHFMQRDGASYVVEEICCFRETGAWPSAALAGPAPRHRRGLPRVRPARQASPRRGSSGRGAVVRRRWLRFKRRWIRGECGRRPCLHAPDGGNHPIQGVRYVGQWR